MKKFSLLIAAVGMVFCASAQVHQTTLFDSTQVVMEESGLSHVVHHQRIRVEDYAGAKELCAITVDYEPQSAYVEFRDVRIHPKNGKDKVLISKEGVNTTIYDYVAPARLIYWGASQKMVQVGHLEPGDEVEYTTYRKGFTYALLGDDDSKYIPPMKGHFYDIVPFWSKTPVQHKVYQVDVLTSKKLRFEIYNVPAGTVRVDSIQRGDRTIYTFKRDNIQPLEMEQSALANNDIEAKLLLSTAPNWESKSMWFYNVNEDYGSFDCTPEIQAKVNEIVKGCKSEQDSIAALTHWVADNIRYAGISMGEGEGYTLHKAEMDFKDRCGVCKDKAGMLVAMLRAAGFKAYAAMTMAHERIDRIPADQFNHSVCAVQHRNGKYEMLDPTWVPNLRELWSSAEQQQGYLMGLPEGATLMYTPISDPVNHYLRVNATTQILKDGTLEGGITITAEGQSDQSVRGIFSCDPSEWTSNLERELLTIAPNAEILDIQTSNPDKYLEQPVSITYRFRIPHYATIDDDNLAFIPLSARNFFKRTMSHLRFNTDTEVRTQPFSDRTSRLVEIKETITLPSAYEKLNFPFIGGVANPAASFGCQYWMEGRTLNFAETVMLGKRVYEASDWPAFRQVVKNQKMLANTPVILTK